MNPQQLKARIKVLRGHAAALEQRIAVMGSYPCDCRSQIIKGLRYQLNLLKQRYREAAFDLLVSGISHRQFMKFIEGLGND
jgi:hypothetical protein